MNRRALLQGLTSSARRAALAVPAERPIRAGVEGYTKRLNRRHAIHLLRRISFGAHLREIDALTGLSVEVAVNMLVDEAITQPLPDPPSWIDQAVPLNEQERTPYFETNQQWVLDYQAAWLEQMFFGGLRERMTLFWHNHFVTHTANYRLAPYAYRYLTVAIAVASLLLAIGLVRSDRVDFVFFPSPESETIRARVVFNAGVPRQTVIAAVHRIEDALHETEKRLSPDKPLVVAVFATIGEAGRSSGDNLAQFRVQLTSSEEREIRTSEIGRAWQRAAPKIAGIKRFAVSRHRGGPRGRDIDIRFRGGDSALLKAAAEEATEVLSGYPGVTGIADDLPYGKPELIIQLTPRGAALGFTGNEIGRQVRNALEGAVPRRFAEGDEEITIRVQAKLREAGMAALRALELRTPSGAFVPLEEVAELSERQGFSSIQRIDGSSSVSVTGDVDLTVTNPGAVLDELRESGVIGEIASRYGVSTGFSGRAEERAKAFSDLKLGVLIAVVVIYIILAWTFGSYAKPVAVMLIMPFGFVGATVGHWLMGFDLTILSLFGLLGLSGILVNDSIILVARLSERLAAGSSLGQAATGASRDRLRAVLLTLLTTIGGLTPLLFETSRQAQFLMPMAITIVFGLAIATFLVLFLVPAIIGIGGDLGAFMRFVADRRALDDTPPTPAE